jgi:hypothetical protein
VELAEVRRLLWSVAADRAAAALVATNDTVVEVSVAPGGRWVARSHNLEWIGNPAGVECWRIHPAGGAREIRHDRAAGWVHPTVGLLWPELLPLWGRPSDTHRPARVIDGSSGPGQILFGPVDGLPEPPTTLDLDPTRWLCLRLEMPGREWTLRDYQVSGGSQACNFPPAPS